MFTEPPEKSSSFPWVTQILRYHWKTFFRGKVNDDRAEIVSMMVSPTCIRTGIGSKLMEKALSHLFENGCKAAILWVVKENTNARRFYESFGFSPSEEQRFIHRYGIELCQLRYEKQL